MYHGRGVILSAHHRSVVHRYGLSLHRSVLTLSLGLGIYLGLTGSRIRQITLLQKFYILVGRKYGTYLLQVLPLDLHGLFAGSLT